MVTGEVMAKRCVFAVLCSTFLLSNGAGAFAADADPKTIKAAQERLQEGNQRFDKGDYEAARVAYEQSLILVPRGSTYRNLGTTEMKLGDPVAALKHLRLALSAPDLNADKKAITQHDLAAAYAATGHIAVSTSPGAKVAVDGRALDGAAPFTDPIDVTVGKHTLEAHLGSASAKMDVDAKGGSVASVDLAIAPSAPTPPATTTSEVPPALPGSTTSIPEAPPSSDSPSFLNTRRAIGVGVAAAGLAALGASAYFYTDGTSQRDRANALAAGLPAGACVGSSPPATCSAAQNARNAQSADQTWGTALIGVGAAAVVVGAALFFWPTSNHSQTAIVPFFSPEGGGLQLRGEL